MTIVNRNLQKLFIGLNVIGVVKKEWITKQATRIASVDKQYHPKWHFCYLFNIISVLQFVFMLYEFLEVTQFPTAYYVCVYRFSSSSLFLFVRLKQKRLVGKSAKLPLCHVINKNVYKM